jgi:hypothetical protein
VSPAPVSLVFMLWTGSRAPLRAALRGALAAGRSKLLCTAFAFTLLE